MRSRFDRRVRVASRASLASLALAACSSGGAAPARTEPTTAEATLLADVGAPGGGGDAAGHGGEGKGALEAALAVGGPRDPLALAAMVRSLDATLDALAAGLMSQPALRADPALRARAVLERLFSLSSSSSNQAARPLLASYVADATTLSDVVTAGRFNCVSATMLYILAARRVGVDARPVLLPSHARALVVAGGRSFVVETTTPLGFDPPASVSREALDRARPRGLGPHVDLYADERGTEVDWNALLGIAYGNLAILARVRGDSALAAVLLARELALTPPQQQPLVRTQEVSLLTELATRALALGEFAEAIALALRADEAAPDARTKRLTGQNLTAFASQELAAEGSKMDDAKLLAFAEPFRGIPSAYGDVRALALTTLGERRLSRGDVDGSASALREAAALATTDDIRSQAGHNARLGELNRLGALSTTDPESAAKQIAALGPPDPTLVETETKVRQAIVENRAVRLANAGSCDLLERVLTASTPRADTLRAACLARHGIALALRGDVAGALSNLRDAVRLDPTAEQHKQNLLVMIEKTVDQLVHGHRCGDIPPLVAEGRAIDPRAKFFDEATEYCKHAR
jgi:tetratricopeptide (TPR) repeat protein